MTLIVFIFTYLAVTYITKYTSLGEYKWFNDLEGKLIYKYPSKESLIRRVFSFKGFHCTSCHSFWLSITVFTYLYEDPINVILALLLYIIKSTNNGND